MPDRTFIYDPDTAMPERVQRLHFELCRKAEVCYELRDQAERDGWALKARHLFAIGDEFFGYALALTGEWDDTPLFEEAT